MVTQSGTTRGCQIPERVRLAWGSPLFLESRLGNHVWQMRQGDRCLVLKKRPSPFNSDLEGSLLGEISSGGVPVARVIPTLTGTNSCTVEESHWSLYPMLPGRSLSLLTITPPEAKNLGAILAATHNALSSFAGGAHLPQLALSRELGGCRVGLIHRDFHTRNVLFEAGRVTAVLDFDLVCCGPLAFDLAYLGASLLADAWQDQASREKIFTVLADIVQGYAIKRPLEAQEVMMIPALLEEVEAIFENHGRASGNTAMERSAAEVRAWLEQRRAAMAQALRTT